nr:MAG TPA: hypothetical protein [Inoviridae sp.]
MYTALGKMLMMAACIIPSCMTVKTSPRICL